MIRSRLFLATLALAGLSSSSCVSSFLADSLVRPARQPLVKAPADYGLPFEEVAFDSPDGVRLAGWLLPGAQAKVVVMTHPMTFTRYGFSAEDQGLFKVTGLEVEFLKTARVLHAAGYTVLTFDFRNHGSSGGFHEGYSAVGLFEWRDVVGALDFLASRSELKEAPVAFVSHCMGANSTIMAMSMARDRWSRVKALVAVQPVAADTFTRLLIADRYPLFSSYFEGIDAKVKERTGFTLEEMSPLPYVKDVPVPTLYVQVEKDPWTRREDLEAFARGTPGASEILWIDGKERFDGYNYFGEHPEALLSFLSKHL